MIYILTGGIRTGKTSTLLDWINTSTAFSGTNRNDIDGVLCPDDENGKRYFLNIKSNEKFILEVEATYNKEAIIKIGPFHFLKSAFKKANHYLIHASKTKDYSYLIVDELGKLELKNEGLHNSAEIIIASHEQNKKQHLILVVRDYLVEEIIKHYNISEHQIIKKQDLEKLI